MAIIIITSSSLEYIGYPYTDTSVFQFLTLNNTAGVTAEFVGHFDDGVSHAILVPQGFPFGDLHHAFIFVSFNNSIDALTQRRN